MSKYGFPYRGSKDKIADEIISVLPSGRRLIDLFGGGGAISHCAVLSGKWEQVVFNDINPLNKRLIDEAITGKYNYSVFKPEFITHERFFELKDTDGYVKYIWSFGNNGEHYMFGRDKEQLKHAAHDYVVFGEWSDFLEPWKCCGIHPLVCGLDDIRGRRMEWSIKVRKHNKRLDIEQLQQLERLQQRLITQAGDYRDYVYQDGDVVYCDIPYQNGYKKKDCYGTGFDFGVFYAWAVSAPFPVYFSSYSLGTEVWRQKKRISFNHKDNTLCRDECLYCVTNDYQPTAGGKIF